MVRWMKHYITLRLGLILWSVGGLLHGSLFYWGYKKFLRIKALESSIVQRKCVLKRALTWQISRPLHLDKLSNFSQELQKYATHFNTIQVAYQTPSQQNAWIEMTITFKVKHDDIFWNFFKNLYKNHKGRIESVALTLSREEPAQLDQETLSPSFPGDEAVKSGIHGVYTVRYYFFNSAG